MEQKFFKKVRVMGILNITPDSFSDGGKFFTAGKLNLVKVLKTAKNMITQGVDIIDIGGESTGPGSRFVSEEEELKRVIPVIKKIAPLAHKKNILISVDTYKAKVAEEAIKNGADIINDVTALRGDKKMAKTIAKSKKLIILMYAKDNSPRTTKKRTSYKDVMRTIEKFLKERINFAQKNGIRKNQIILDPGMGAFISTNPKYSFEILRRLCELKKLKQPILIGPSNKSFLGGTMESRKITSRVAAFFAIVGGASIVRMHNITHNESYKNLHI